MRTLQSIACIFLQLSASAIFIKAYTGPWMLNVPTEMLFSINVGKSSGIFSFSIPFAWSL